MVRYASTFRRALAEVHKSRPIQGQPVELTVRVVKAKYTRTSRSTQITIMR